VATTVMTEITGQINWFREQTTKVGPNAGKPYGRGVLIVGQQRVGLYVPAASYPRLAAVLAPGRILAFRGTRRETTRAELAWELEVFQAEDAGPSRQATVSIDGYVVEEEREVTVQGQIKDLVVREGKDVATLGDGTVVIFSDHDPDLGVGHRVIAVGVKRDGVLTVS
jgi:hypothetical protein